MVLKKTTVQFEFVQMVLFSAQTDELMGISHRNVATILWRIFLGSRFGESCLSFHTISARLCEYMKFTAGLTCPHKVGGQSINDVTFTGPWQMQSDIQPDIPPPNYMIHSPMVSTLIFSLTFMNGPLCRQSPMLFRNVVRKQRTMAQMSTHIFSALLYRLQTPTPNTIDDIFTPKYHANVKIYKEKCYNLIPIFPGIIVISVGFTQVNTVYWYACLYDQQS